MKYTYTTPEVMCSKYHECGDTQDFINGVLKEHPNARLGKADLWTIDWTRSGYARGTHIVLKDVSDEDLDVMRVAIFPELKPFEVMFKKDSSIKGYVDEKENKIWIQGEERLLNEIFYKHHFEYDVEANYFIKRTLLKYRSNLKEYVLDGNRKFKINELFHWGKTDPLVDIRHELSEMIMPVEFIDLDNGNWYCYFKEKKEIEINYCRIKTESVSKIGNDIFVEDLKINEYMIRMVVC